MGENAFLRDVPLANFSSEVTLYRGMAIDDLENIGNWFKYGYESYSCKEQHANRAWMESSNSHIKSHPYGIDSFYCRDNDSMCNSYGGGGFTGGVVYMSTSASAIHRFFAGTYGKGKYSIVQEIKISSTELHVSPAKYECAIHLPSLKPENIAAVHIVNYRTAKILETYINPYNSQTMPTYGIDQESYHDHSNCPYFSGINELEDSEYREDPIKGKWLNSIIAPFHEMKDDLWYSLGEDVIETSAITAALLSFSIVIIGLNNKCCPSDIDHG